LSDQAGTFVVAMLGGIEIPFRIFWLTIIIIMPPSPRLFISVESKRLTIPLTSLDAKGYCFGQRRRTSLVRAVAAANGRKW
jgi:hypothetical protein